MYSIQCNGNGQAMLKVMAFILFRYPKIYSTGIAIAAVADQLTYDNIYQERYMGIPQENREDFVNGWEQVEKAMW